MSGLSGKQATKEIHCPPTTHFIAMIDDLTDVLNFDPENVTPRIRCARCLLVIRRHCHVICLRVAFYHVIMCISFCIRVRLMHPSIFPVVRFAIRHSYALRRPLLASLREWVLNFLGMA